MAEYIVTVKKEANWQELNTDLSTDTSADASVDSNIIPDRAVSVVDLRATNTRNTHYDLTADEVTKLKNDNRIEDVQAVSDIGSPVLSAVQDGIDTSSFNKGTDSDGNQDNYGLLRHISATNNFGASILDPDIPYNYVLDGTGVDVVIMDSGIQKDHPEFQDANGASRLQQINWFTESGISGTQGANFYTDQNGHGTHCAGTVAGKTFGWAKNAKIYAMKIQDTDYISATQAFDIITAWHGNKSGADAGRPTVVNMSFGYALVLNTNVTPNTIAGFNIAGGTYRGTSHTETTRTNLAQYGIFGGTTTTSGVYHLPRRITSVDADIQQMIDAGIHVVVASGNDYMKHDEVAGTDYNNLITDGAGLDHYYHRGASPHDDQVIKVGSLDSAVFDASTDQKADFSNAGPGTDVFACGKNIISSIATSSSNYTESNYFANSSFKQAKSTGTSMAAPQVAGIAALVCQVHPDWTPAQIKGWIVNNSGTTIKTTGANDDYSVNTSLWGASQKVAYLTMNGASPFNYTAS